MMRETLSVWPRWMEEERREDIIERTPVDTRREEKEEVEVEVEVEEEEEDDDDKEEEEEERRGESE